MHITSTKITPFLVLISFTLGGTSGGDRYCSGLTRKLPHWFCALSKISAFDMASSKVNASSSNSRCLMNEEVIPVMNASRVNSHWNS